MNGSLVYRKSKSLPPILFLAERVLADKDLQNLRNLKFHDEVILDETGFKTSRAVVLEAAKRRRLSPVGSQPANTH